MQKEWKCIEIDEPTWIPFEWKDLTPGGGNLGHMEFQVCIKFKGGKISEFWVYPRQSRLNVYWHYTGGRGHFTITSYEELENAWAWMFSYCKDHKATSFSVYVPKHSKVLKIDYDGLSFWKTNFSKVGKSY